MNEWIKGALETLQTKGIEFGLKLLGAIAVWIIGRMLINFVLKLLKRALRKAEWDETLERYLLTSLKALLTIGLVAGILGFFDVETTTFAAMLAAAGVAIGMAWSGLLANFAAGAFLVVLRPFKNDDYVVVGGTEGTVEEIGLFTTTINTPDNVKVIIGNNKVFSEPITNYSANETRRVNLVAQLAHSVDPEAAIAKLKPAIEAIPNIAKNVGPDLHILEFNLAGPVLCVRPHCNTKDYWQVYFDTNMAIRKTLGDAGYPVPENHYRIQQAKG